jgi:hypothetical protein
MPNPHEIPDTPEADCLGHRPAGPVGRLVRRFRARHRHHLHRRFRRDRRLTGLGGLVAQQSLNPGLGKPLLPPLHGWPTDADALGYPLRRVSIRRGEHDARPLDVLARFECASSLRPNIPALAQAMVQYRRS